MAPKRDPFWDYAVRKDSSFKCTFCNRDFHGGATRLKAHLAGVVGHDIRPCGAVTEAVRKAAQATQESNKRLKRASTTSGAEKRKFTSASTSEIMDRIVTQVFI